MLLLRSLLSLALLAPGGTSCNFPLLSADRCPIQDPAVLMEKMPLAGVHVLHPRSLLVGTQVEVLCSLTSALAQTSNFNCFKSPRMIWTCLLGVMGMLTSPSVLTEGRTAITAAPRKAGCNLESEQMHWLNGIHLKLP